MKRKKAADHEKATALRKEQQHMNSPFIMVYPQWQGGGDPVTYYGAKELVNLYLSNTAYEEVPTSINAELTFENGIIGYADINHQMQSSYHLLKTHSPEKIFAIGGGCDADVPVIAYLNARYSGNLLVLWLDAHGDLNAPKESQTGLFYGMPARILMGESGLFTDVIEYPLRPQQLVQIGGRDFDEAELKYMQQNHICRISCKDLCEAKCFLKQYKECNIYVHLDLDVINPDEFPNTPLPVRDGASKDATLDLLSEIISNYPFVGLGLYEYAPSGQKTSLIESIFDLLLK